MTFTDETLALFTYLLDQVVVKANQPDFDAVCASISRARAELEAAVPAPPAD